MGLTPGVALPQQYANAQGLQAQLAALPAPQLVPVPSLPTPAAPLASPNQVLTDEDNLSSLRHSGPGVGQIHNPFLRGLARVADITGSVFLPGLSAAIPGTTIHHQVLVNQAQNNLANDQVSAQRQAQTDNLNLQPQLKQQAAALAEEKQNNTEDHQQAVLDQQRQLQLARNGQMETTGPDGQKHIVDDPDSQVFQSRKILGDYHTAQIGLEQANAELKLAGNDPNSPAYKLAQSKVQTAQQNANAAGVRAQSYMGRYLQSAYNVGLDHQVLPGAPQIADQNGNITTPGTANAAQAVKAQANVAQFGDVGGALDNLEQSARALVASGGRLNSPGVVYALQHAGSGTPSQIIQSLDKANLTPEERDYVVSNLAAHENVQALRKSAGGTATDSAVEKLDALLPNGTTPNIDYLLQQTGQIRQTAGRLGKGVTTVQGGLKLPTEGAPEEGAPLGTTTKSDGVYEMNGRQFRVKGGKVYAR